MIQLHRPELRSALSPSTLLNFSKILSSFYSMIFFNTSTCIHPFSKNTQKLYLAISSTANTALLCSFSIYASYTISHNRAIERKKVKSLNHVQLFATPWTVAYQVPPSMEFSRQEYWSGGMGCLFLLQWIYPTQGSNPGPPHCRQMLYHLSHQLSISIYIKKDV